MDKVRWTDQAVDDIENIAEFISKDSVKYAKIQVKRFFDITRILEKQNKFGRIVPEINNDKIREIIQGNYRIIYRIVSDNQIDIITVHHSRRQLSSNPVFNKEFDL
ncbi:MAG: type II toxin-antitoxin system RelE/ParE family toxin [Marinilabiliales bacterium]|nr:MAG: type II toxin-antitoxin system RelE/ParE family toxin [Marinilabiliales bacterium]